MPKEQMIYGTLFSLSNRIQTMGDEFLSEITMKQHFVLMTLCLFDDKTPSLKDVSHIVGCSYQNIKKVAINLEKKGYLRIEHNKDDKRKWKKI